MNNKKLLFERWVVMVVNGFVFKFWDWVLWLIEEYGESKFDYYKKRFCVNSVDVFLKVWLKIYYFDL